jgi:phage recombination protein Bet
MSTELIQFDPKEENLLKKTIAKGTTDEQFDLFVKVCAQTGLNPFARQIYAVVRKTKQKDHKNQWVWVPTMTIQTSIDGYRLLAQRSNEYAGQDGPYWYDAKTKTWTDVWIEDYSPAAARVGVLRKGFKDYLYAVAKFESYCARAYNEKTKKNDGELQNLWAKMPEVMIAKVAEALALRRAFPAELSGIYTKEEMDQADNDPLPTPDVDTRPVRKQSVQITEQSPTPIEAEPEVETETVEGEVVEHPEHPEQSDQPENVSEMPAQPETLSDNPGLKELSTFATSIGIDFISFRQKFYPQIKDENGYTEKVRKEMKTRLENISKYRKAS